MSGAATDIAVIGMSCRFPGVDGLGEFWRLLVDGKPTVGRFPGHRADISKLASHPDAAAVTSGSFFDSIDGFDAHFFGTDHAEASAMDPVQRLGLELAWEAVEDARVPAVALAGREIDVLVGAASSGYDVLRRLSGSDRDDQYAALGSSDALIANRISSMFDVRGMSFCTDSGQSSSLVSLALACERIRSGAVDMALVGGVHLIVDPAAGLGLANLGVLSPDGRCFSFDERASGFVRGEGGAFVVLKRRDSAVVDGDHIYAVVRGWGVGSGGASSRIPDPSPGAQAATVLSALERAAFLFDSIDYVEAHGTGTRLGDPAEISGLREVFRETGRSRPLAIGSVKTNVGHLEPAAGIVGFVKTALCVDRARLVPSLNFRSPNPAIPHFQENFEVLAATRSWPSAPGRPRRAGVSAFGMGGTNAHIILEQEVEERTGPRGAGAGTTSACVSGALPWVLSARSESALRGQAARLRDLVGADASLSVVDVGYSLVSTRSLFEHRAVVLGAEQEELAAGLAGLVAGEPGPNVVTGTVPVGGPGRVGFVFAGQGAQRPGMGRDLHAVSPAFAAAFDQACDLLEADLGLPVAEVVLGEGEDRRADQTVFAQAGLFAVEVGLVALLAEAGITPDAVAGHSVGEIAAAHAAGVLSLEDACALVAARGRLMQALPTGGAMIAVQATETEITAASEGVAGVSVAAVNGPSSVVISGDAEPVARLAARFKDQGRRTRELRVSHGFHSHRMEPVLDELGQVAAKLRHAAPQAVWAEALTGQLVSVPGPEYWVRQARGAVRYADAVATLAAQGVSVFVEIGPDETLSGMGAAALDDPDGTVFAPMLRPGRPASEAVLAGLAEAFVHGVPVDWAEALTGGRRLDLPTYAFQRQRYWLTAPDETDTMNTGSTTQPAGPGVHRPAVVGARSAALDSELSVLKLVCSETAAVLGKQHTELTGPDFARRSTETFKDLGVDSSMALRLRTRLAQAVGVRLPATVVFTYPTPQSLGHRIFALLAPEAPDAPEAAEETSPDSRSDDELYELIDRGYV
ncbi:beta-ketoacyl synthase N-terminal-like domain-containing protein [Streptomyces sp. NPDC047525]|uniref:type I polyketide synthase n=1 Tax=Streptomyces sp. NPDC047525 TaxID=3155264 RepID=UPI0033DF6760